MDWEEKRIARHDSFHGEILLRAKIIADHGRICLQKPACGTVALHVSVFQTNRDRADFS